MGVTAAQKALQILENVEYIVAIELLCAPQAIKFRDSEKLGKGTKIAHLTIRKAVPMIREDRVLGEKIEKIRQMIKDRIILNEIKKNNNRSGTRF